MEECSALLFMVTAVALHLVYTHAIAKRKGKSTKAETAFAQVLYLLHMLTLQAEYSNEFFVMGQPETKLEVINALHQLGKFYVKEHDNVTFSCSVTADYNGSYNVSSIEVDFEQVDTIIENRTSRLGYDDNVQWFVIEGIQLSWLHDEHDFLAKCRMPDQKLTNVGIETIEVTRRPLPIEFSEDDCHVPDGEYMVCTWLPTFDAQKEHTNMKGAREPLKQMVSWKVLYDPAREAKLDIGPIDQRANTLVFNNTDERFYFALGVEYSITVKVYALPEQYEHAEEKTITINTTKIVKMNPVRGLTYRSVTNTSAEMIWSLPNDKFPLIARLNYTCQYAGETQEGCVGTVSESGTETYTLTTLLPNTQYVVLMDVTVPGSIHWSDSRNKTFTTLPSAPVRNPVYHRTMFSLIEAPDCSSHDCISTCRQQRCHSPTSVRVYWQPLNRWEYYGPGFNYEVNIAGVSDPSQLDSSDLRSVVITFDKRVGIEVKVTSRNDEGSSTATQDTEMRISGTGHELHVDNLMISSDNGSTVNVSWTMSLDNAEKYEFTLFWCTRSTGNGEPVSLHICESQVSFQSISPVFTQPDQFFHSLQSPHTYTDMLFGVSVSLCDSNEDCGKQYGNSSSTGYRTRRRRQANDFTSGGIVWTNGLFLRTKKAVYSNLEKVVLHLTAEDGHSIAASWEYVCEHVCGYPDLYIVEYCPPAGRCYQKETTATSIMLTDLEERTEYTVTIKVRQKVGGEDVLMSTKVKKGPKYIPPGIPTAARVGIGIAVVVFIISCIIAILVCYKCSKSGRKWYRIPVTLPTDFLSTGDNRRSRRLPSGCSRRAMLDSGSQSSDGRPPYSSQPSREPLISTSNHNGTHLPNGQPPIPETPEDDDVFPDGDIQMTEYTTTTNNGHISHSHRDDVTPPPRPHLNNQLPNQEIEEEGEVSHGEYLHPLVPVVENSIGSIDSYSGLIIMPGFTPTPHRGKEHADRGEELAAGNLHMHEQSQDDIANPPQHHFPQCPVPEIAGMKSSISAPISVHDPAAGRSPTETSDGLYSPEMEQRRHHPGVPSRQEPVENYWGYNTMFNNKGQGKPNGVEKFMAREELPRFNSEPSMTKRVALPPVVAKGGSHDELKKLDYVSLDNNVITSPKKKAVVAPVVVKDSVKSVGKIDLKRTSNEPVETGVYLEVDLPEKPVFGTMDIDKEKAQLKNDEQLFHKEELHNNSLQPSPPQSLSIQSKSPRSFNSSDYVVPSDHGFVPRDSLEPACNSHISQSATDPDDEYFYPENVTHNIKDDVASPEYSTSGAVPIQDFLAKIPEPLRDVTQDLNIPESLAASDFVPDLGKITIEPPLLNGGSIDLRSFEDSIGNGYRPTAVRIDNGQQAIRTTDSEEPNSFGYCPTRAYVT